MIVKILICMCIFLFPIVGHADALLITRTSGNVFVKENSEKKNVPSTVFALFEHQTLVLEEGSFAILLRNGVAQQVTGPKKISPNDWKEKAVSTQKNNSLSRLLSKKSSIRNIGASRSLDGFQLQRPLSSGTLIEAKEVRWYCHDCDVQEVQILSVDEDLIWSGAGKFSVQYDDEPLPPGPYLLDIGGLRTGFQIADAEQQNLLRESLRELHDQIEHMPLLDRVSLYVAVLEQAGMPSEVLYALDTYTAQTPSNIELHNMLLNYQSRYLE